MSCAITCLLAPSRDEALPGPRSRISSEADTNDESGQTTGMIRCIRYRSRLPGGGKMTSISLLALGGRYYTRTSWNTANHAHLGGGTLSG